MKKTFVLLILLVIACLAGWQIKERISSFEKGTDKKRSTPNIAIESEPIRYITIRETVLFTGNLYAKSMVVVAPRIAGQLEKLMVNIGDQVKQGQLIATLEDDEYVQQVDQAKAELEVGMANLEESRVALENSKREFERATSLRKNNVGSVSELDAFEAAYKTNEAKLKVAQAQIAQKQAVLKSAQIRLSYTKIQAYWKESDGLQVVGERFVDEGAMLASNTPIISIMDISSMIAVTYVIERDYAKMSIGHEAVISTDAFPDKIFTGKIVRIAPLLKESSGKARVEIEIINEQSLLKPGMFARVNIEFDKHENAAVVSVSSLVKREDKQGVFLINEKEMKANFIPVTIGIIANQEVEIAQPVQLSGLVVTLGQHLLEDGSSIVLPDKKPKSKPDQGGKQ